MAFLKSFATRLPESLPLATFRFDCRGLGESTGATSYTPHHCNLEDLRACVALLTSDAHGFVVHAVLGYSAGGNVAAM